MLDASSAGSVPTDHHNDGHPFQLSRTGASAARPDDVLQRAAAILAVMGVALADAKVLVVGVAARPGRADVRASPALETIDRLREVGTSVSFTDDLVGDLSVRGGRLSSVQPGDAADWDLVVVHTLHPGADCSWLARVPALLDAGATAVQLGGSSAVGLEALAAA